MNKAFLSKLVQASLVCCLALILTGCEDLFGEWSKPVPATPAVTPETPSVATITVAPVATTGDIATGSTTALVTIVTADGGTMMYQVTVTNTKPTSTEGFTATVPTAEGLEPGTYYVWYYAKGDATHADSEISATAITVIISNKPVATIATDPVATTGDVIAGSTTALVSAGTAEGGTMMYKVTTTNDKPASTEGFSETVPTAASLAAGNCYVWYYVKGDADHSDSNISATAITVTLAKPAATITTAPTATSGTIYAGSTTAVVTAGAASGGTMMYKVTDANTKPTSTEGFIATVPTAEGRAAGTFYVWYYVKGDETHADSEIEGSVTVTISNKPAATVSTAPTATTGDIVAGSTTALVSAGTASGGTMMYKVTTTNTKPTSTEGFSATVPTAAAQASGTCYVWYYAKGDADHSDSAISSSAIAVTIIGGTGSLTPMGNPENL